MEAKRQRANAQAERMSAPPASNSARVGLVEDSDVVRKFAHRLLTTKGFQVTEHVDGQAALEQLLLDPPDLVISDIQMPRMDGLELTRRLREKFDKRALPIVLVSVLSEEEDIVAGFEAGANDYLVKPYRTAELLAKIAVLLRERTFLRDAQEPLLPATEATPPVILGDEEETQVRKGTDPAAPHYYFDKYVVSGEFGRGGMGTVYRAIQRDDGREVALKVLAPRLSGNRTAIARFLRECRVLSSLEAENVVRVLDHGYDAGRYFLVMEAVEGDSLDRIVLRDGPLPEPELARTFWQVGRALQDLSSCDLVHRDVKPANIVRRTTDGVVKLVDFGLAKHMHEPTTLTETGYALGTSYYVAPEVIEGAPSDARSDLFALGVSMYEALTGRRPFAGVVPYQIFKRIVAGQVPDPNQYRADLSPGLVEIVLRLLRTDPGERFQDGGELEQTLRAWYESDEGRRARAAAPTPAPISNL